MQMSYGLKETLPSLISHYPKEKREAFEFHKKFWTISLSSIKFTFTIQTLIWSDVTYVFDIKQLYQEFRPLIISINDAILVPFVYFTTPNWISVAVYVDIFYNKLVENIMSLELEFPQKQRSSQP